jgi:hypothetical protein
MLIQGARSALPKLSKSNTRLGAAWRAILSATPEPLPPSFVLP